MASFHLSNTSVQFGQFHALKSLHIDIQPAERLALIGTSGSGKTTLLKLLNAQIKASQGEVQILGEQVDTLSPKRLRQLRSHIAFIPQHLGLISNLRVFQNIMLGRVGKRSTLGTLRDLAIPADEEMQKIFDILNSLGIAEKLYQRTSSLSGGQQQRVALARALYQNPEVLLADEPVSAVDPARARSMVQLLNKIASENKLTLIMSIHNIELAQEFFPRVIGLRGGEISYDGTNSQLDPAALERIYKLNTDELSQ